MEQNEIDYFGRMIAEDGRAVAPQEHPQTIITRLRATLAERDAEIAALQRYVACCMGGELYTALDAQFPDWPTCVEALRARGDIHAPELIEQMATEIARLRTVLVSREGTADHLRAVNAQMDKDIQKQCAAEYERDAKIARLRSDAMEEAACIADFYSTENFRLAGDTILTDPVIQTGGRDQSIKALALSGKLQTEGCVHASMAHAAQNIAAAIRNAIGEDSSRLRADPNRLDLASVPSGWRFMSLLHPREARIYQRFFAYLERDTTGQTVDGIGPTPAAALAAAVARVK